VNAPRKVLWLIKGLGPGGAERLLVAAATAHDRDAFTFEVAYLLPWKHHLVDELEALGVHCTCLDVRDERDLRWVGRLRRRLVADPVDIVHAHSPYVASFARLAVRTLPRRIRPAVVTTEHNPWSRFKAPTRALNAVTAPLDDATFAVSEEARASMWPWARKRTTTLSHGIAIDAARAQLAQRDAVRAELGVDAGTFLAGTVANYHPKKDWPNLLRAARLLADRGVPVKFCAVGQGPLEADVIALHEELGLAGTVTLTGYRPDAVRLMAGCDCFVLASQWEGLPVAVMEACALGLPIVSTAVGGMKESFTDGVDALLVPPAHPDLLADALQRVACDGALRARLAAASAARAADFDIARAVGCIEETYREVLA
jgi:glycosyltransferase involved in cell wall biosynthesis